jgi:SAM-dependent methyltransferase
MNTQKEKLTSDDSYAEGLVYRQSAWWKKLLNVQLPYKWNINRLELGFVLDVGCGIGRNLLHLNGNGIGVDHNPLSIKISKERGLKAFLVEDFMKSQYCKPENFDSILIAHVAEHLTTEEFDGILKEYLPYLKKGGKIVVITPQESGFKIDSTHVKFVDFKVIARVFEQFGLEKTKQYSFPFPRIIGKVFPYNEFVNVGTKIS